MWKGHKIPYNWHVFKGRWDIARITEKFFMPVKFDFLKSGFHLTSIQRTELAG